MGGEDRQAPRKEEERSSLNGERGKIFQMRLAWTFSVHALRYTYGTADKFDTIIQSVGRHFISDFLDAVRRYGGGNLYDRYNESYGLGKDGIRREKAGCYENQGIQTIFDARRVP